MTTVLEYLVIAAVIGGIVFALAVLVFGRGEQMAALPSRTSPTELPDDGITGQDVRSIRFAMAVRGYRMSDVDWALERMATELDSLRAQLAERTVVGVGGGRDELAERRSADESTAAAGPGFPRGSAWSGGVDEPADPSTGPPADPGDRP